MIDDLPGDDRAKRDRTARLLMVVQILRANGDALSKFAVLDQALFAYAGVAGRAPQLRGVRRTGELPSQSVLSTTTTHN